MMCIKLNSEDECDVLLPGGITVIVRRPRGSRVLIAIDAPKTATVDFVKYKGGAFNKARLKDEATDGTD